MRWRPSALLPVSLPAATREVAPPAEQRAFLTNTMPSRHEWTLMLCPQTFVGLNSAGTPEFQGFAYLVNPRVGIQTQH